MMSTYRIRVTGVSDDDEDWLLGESLDGSRVGGFPRVRVPSSQAIKVANHP
jgi:hypothetical protein